MGAEGGAPALGVKPAGAGRGVGCEFAGCVASKGVAGVGGEKTGGASWGRKGAAPPPSRMVKVRPETNGVGGVQRVGLLLGPPEY